MRSRTEGGRQRRVHRLRGGTFRCRCFAPAESADPSCTRRPNPLHTSSAGTARHEPWHIPEAIHLSWELSLCRSWSAAHGSHLTSRAWEDILANDHGGPATPSMTVEKPVLRARLRAARDQFA